LVQLLWAVACAATRLPLSGSSGPYEPDQKTKNNTSGCRDNNRRGKRQGPIHSSSWIVGNVAWSHLRADFSLTSNKDAVRRDASATTRHRTISWANAFQKTILQGAPSLTQHLMRGTNENDLHYYQHDNDYRCFPYCIH
jgi:hypothetical protein